jgi:hypothetical protein
MKILSKSPYCLGLQCPKILWLKTNCPEEEQISASVQNDFDRVENNLSSLKKLRTNLPEPL